MKKFMNESFLLTTSTAENLYNTYVKDLPIYDYHCHLNPKEIYEDKPFENITQMFLGGDHYKWRLMRSNGIDERFITGDATASEKFKAFAATLQYAIGSPIYHWTHLELRKYFGIKETLCESNALTIMDKCNDIIKQTEMSPRKVISSSGVKVICTTDDPADSLEYHIKLAESGQFDTKVLPTFRPDNALNIDKATFAEYMGKLNVSTYDQLKSRLIEKIEFFHSAGCRISDHAVDYVPYVPATDSEVAEIFLKGLTQPLSCAEIEKYKSCTMRFVAAQYSRLGWTMQIHIGALRNNNTRMFNRLGPDTGFDSINDLQIAQPLSRFMDSLDKDGNLPKTILYTLNPKDNYVLATMLGNFQDSGTRSKIQFGSAWWFNDTIDGMTEQIKAFANLGMLSNFVGMLTDSRSFLSYPRHDYFRRIVCSVIGKWVEDGLFPNNIDILGTIAGNIAYYNAVNYFGIDMDCLKDRT